MLRGRHRGLPVAIDRAIMLPTELQKAESIFYDNASAQHHPESGGAHPFRRSDTIMSHRSGGSEMRYRHTRQPSRVFNKDDLELVPEQREKQASSSSGDEESTKS